MSAGWQMRLGILRSNAEHKILSPLKVHRWQASIKQEVEKGDYLVIEASRNGRTHSIALLYSSGTANEIYKRLNQQVEHIFVNGSVSINLQSFAYGISKPVESIDDFHDLLLQWNQDSTDGSFAPLQIEDVSAESEEEESGYKRIQSENPLKSVWIHLRQLESVTLSKKLIEKRVTRDAVVLPPEVITSKGEGLAYAIRNAYDYYRSAEGRSMSQRVLNLYYGTLAFAFAEVLSSPQGPTTLGKIEDSTKQGHGLGTFEGAGNGLGDLIIVLNQNGFFPTYMAALGHPTAGIPTKKPRRPEDLQNFDHQHWITFEELISRVPDIGDLFVNIFDSKPGWIIPHYDSEANNFGGLRSHKKASRSYVRLIDRSKRWTKEDVTLLKAPLGEISEVGSSSEGRSFRAVVDHTGHDNFWDALKLHRSPFLDTALIVPAFGSVDEFRAICLAILYALSIVVRYRPSLWRRVQEGDLDHVRVLIEAYLDVIERVLPEQFLEMISGQKVVAKQPGGMF